MPKTYYCCENNSKKNNNIDYDNNYNDNDNDINNFFKDISQSQSQSQSQSTKKYSKHHSISNTLKNTLHCINLDTTFNIPKHTKTTNTTMNYAIITLLFGNSYLPGILLLGSSIRKVMPNEYKKYIQLCCMVTNDVTPESRSMISKIYDRIIDVKYIQIPTNLIDHKDESTRNTYSKTFTKLRIFEFTEYEKVLFLDADMLVVKDEIFSLFNLRTPAAIFLGKLSNNPRDRYFKDEDQLQIFKDKYCKTDGIHGKLIPYSSFDNEKASQGMNIETSVLLISPNIKLVLQRDNFLDNIRNNKTRIKGDTEMISRMFKDNIYAIEPRFFGRWVSPDENPEIVILDLYGNEGKPWDIEKLKTFVDFKDAVYWWKTYIDTYNTTYKLFNNKMLHILYVMISALYEKVKAKDFEALNMAPQFQPNDMKMFFSYIDKAKYYLEFGSGGSTYHVSRKSNIKKMFSVESDLAWYTKMSSMVDRNDKEIKLIYIDMNTQPKQWGNPGKNTTVEDWNKYSDVIRTIDKNISSKLDVVLIDGRFRAVCCLKCFDVVSNDCLIIFDDFVIREFYHIVLDYYDIVNITEDAHMVVLKKKTDCVKPSKEIISKYENDPR